MPQTQAAPCHLLLNLAGQPEQPNRVRDRGTILSHRGGDLLLAHLKLPPQPLERPRLLDRVELLPLKILHEGQSQRPPIVRLANYHWSFGLP
jgi:hypothetical protein